MSRIECSSSKGCKMCACQYCATDTTDNNFAAKCTKQCKNKVMHFYFYNCNLNFCGIGCRLDLEETIS